MSGEIRFAVVDNHPMFRTGVIQTLAPAQLTCVAEGTSPEEAVRIAGEQAPDIILLDSDRAGLSLAAVRTIASNSPEVRILLLAGTPDQEQVTPYEPTVAWLPIALVVGLVVAGIVAYVVSERRATRGRRSGEARATPPHVLGIRPAAGTPCVGQLERRSAVLAAAASDAERLVEAALSTGAWLRVSPAA